jgi:hypothetical protein
MALLPKNDRIRIWNALFHQAWSQAYTLAKVAGKNPRSGHFSPQPILSEEERLCLALLAYCTLAIEARVNHLIDELVEEGRLGEREAGSFQRLSADAKWFLLPKIAGVKKRLKRDTSPHQAIVEICAQRNVLFHVNFHRLKDGLPATGKMLALFRDFVVAMEDMNVLLRRIRRRRKRVIDIGVFS